MVEGRSVGIHRSVKSRRWCMEKACFWLQTLYTGVFELIFRAYMTTVSQLRTRDDSMHFGTTKMHVYSELGLAA